MTTSPHATAARQSKREAAEALQIDPGFIRQMVEEFYATIRSDARLGPIFAARIADWDEHLDRMTAFWSSVLHESGGFRGNPMAKHIAIPGVERDDFLHWLALFGATLDRLERDPRATQLIAARARMIADSLLTGIRIHRDGRTDADALKGLEDAG
ncbi:group III truncated hemoglobin [Sphingopyxis microcysteis]|uniref:group III truncated hemoglobin n=1 Tax=Sphingopyxis microcysteis TaxID=2484145 RepID=UPI001444E417|nr:group III truncated hemoglobin [Sphingopyxis microcysteis]